MRFTLVRGGLPIAKVETTAKFVEMLLSIDPFTAGERSNPDRSMMHRHDVARLPETAESDGPY
ncbi:MAG: hypothetical protein AAGD43_28640 [Pseudomonadota bacterium]